MNRKKKKAAQSLLLSAVLVGINIMDSSLILAEDNTLSWDGITELSASDIYFRAETSQAELWRKHGGQFPECGKRFRRKFRGKFRELRK